MRARVCAFLVSALFVSALFVPTGASAATVTTKYSLTNAGWTDLGVGPLLLSFNGTGVFAIGDTTPTLSGEGFGVRAGRSFPLKTTSHVWAMGGGLTGVNAYAAPISGGGGSTGCSQATTYLARTTGGNAGGNAVNITTLICGLVTDGVWPKLDAFYVLAQQNQPDARLNLIGTNYSLTSGLLIGFSPTPRALTFTPYVGFSGFFNGMDTGFNPATATSPNFVQNSASFGVWAYSSAAESAGQIGTLDAGSAGESHIYDNLGGTFYARVNAASTPGVPSPGTPGLYVGDRSSSASIVPYYDGVAQATQSGASATPYSSNFKIGQGGSGTAETGQTLSEAHIGASLGATLNLALYNRLRTYMTAVGVP